MQVPKEQESMLQKRKRNEFNYVESDLSKYGYDIAAILKARDAKRKAKQACMEAEVNYKKAKSDLEELRDNLLAAFESSEEPKD